MLTFFNYIQSQDESAEVRGHEYGRHMNSWCTCIPLSSYGCRTSHGTMDCMPVVPPAFWLLSWLTRSVPESQIGSHVEWASIPCHSSCQCPRYVWHMCRRSSVADDMINESTLRQAAVAVPKTDGLEKQRTRELFHVRWRKWVGCTGPAAEVRAFKWSGAESWFSGSAASA